MHVQLCTILVSRAVTLYDRPPLHFQAVDLTSQHEVTYACFSVNYNKINIVQHCVHFIVLLLFLLQKLFLMVNLVFPIVLPTTAVDSMLLVMQKMKTGTKRSSGWNIDILIFRNTLVSHLKFGKETLETPVIYTNNVHDLNQEVKQCNNYYLGNQVTLFLEGNIINSTFLFL